jgi:hypothetical protein
VSAISSEAIVVTGSRITRKALQEELGDLKLYHIPDPVTVAANSQKQVAMLEKSNVKVETIYRQQIVSDAPDDSPPPVKVIRTRNRTAEGLGLPLPAGRLVAFGSGSARPILLGEGFLEDRAVGEDVEIELGRASGIAMQPRVLGTGAKREIELVVTNDRASPSIFEAIFDGPVAALGSSQKLERRDGRPVWRVTIPANGRASLRYRTRL